MSQPIDKAGLPDEGNRLDVPMPGHGSGADLMPSQPSIDQLTDQEPATPGVIPSTQPDIAPAPEARGDADPLALSSNVAQLPSDVAVQAEIGVEVPESLDGGPLVQVPKQNNQMGGSDQNREESLEACQTADSKTTKKARPQKRSRVSVGNGEGAKKAKYEVDPADRFYPLQSLKFVHQMGKTTISNEAKQRLEKELDSIKETNLSEEIPFETDLEYATMVDRLERHFQYPKPAQENDQSDVKRVKKSKKRPGKYDATFALPILLLASTLKVSVKEKGAEIVKLASEWILTKKNLIYDSESFKRVQNSFSPPTTFFSRIGFPSKAENEIGKVLPVVVIQDDQSVDEDLFQHRVTSLTTCIVRGYKDKNFDALSIDALKEVCKEQELRVLVQRPQHSTSNLKLSGKTESWVVEKSDRSWMYPYFASVFNKSLEAAVKAYEKFTKSTSKTHEKIMNEIQADLTAAQLSFDTGASKGYTFPVIYFGSNVDLTNEGPVHDALNFLASFLKPREGLMNLLDVTLKGINEVQIYFKYPGCRTVVHQENQGLGSINLNIGEGDCVWFAVAMEHSAKMERLMCTHKVWPYASSFWPREEDLIGAGIPYRKFIQRKGDLVYVGIGTWHWVQSNNFCANVAWNVMQTDYTQLATAGIIHDHNAEQSYQTVLPMATLIWKIAKENVLPMSPFSELLKGFMARSLAKTKFEFDFWKNEGVEVKPISECKAEVPKSLRCMNKECPRDEIFSVFCTQKTSVLRALRRNEEDATSVYCTECVKKELDFECYFKHSIEELIELYDGYN